MADLTCRPSRIEQHEAVGRSSPRTTTRCEGSGMPVDLQVWCRTVRTRIHGKGGDRLRCRGQNARQRCLAPERLPGLQGMRRRPSRNCQAATSPAARMFRIRRAALGAHRQRRRHRTRGRHRAPVSSLGIKPMPTTTASQASYERHSFSPTSMPVGVACERPPRRRRGSVCAVLR